ncbi:sigma-54-dependent transcriptional regulator [Aliidiomarina haloalkalitolerans]|uniref:Sigma-54-dependent Fis family transcriptional regulator n=1 Tax=Aliidiomarina haloalkalitolerans TaxID=859059 RepID=A0A432VRX7_9GAMM|nr:sigma-54 dependent transcriptional regulator [Aliidiomarina haloalkalitolerans]RUO19113.1 sigma-54-dependent Fis family transcriptional regulator [Aliidiomarina haloalkalitolerans]
MAKWNERIIVVEDDPGLAELLVEELESEGFRVRHFLSVEEALPHIESGQPDLVLSDLRLPGADGMTLVKQVKSLSPAPLMLLITAFGSVSQAVAALKQGADDFMTKPLDMEHLLLTIQRLLKHRRLEQEVSQLRQQKDNESFHGMVGHSRAMRQLYQNIQQVAAADAPVLVLGESGTGKELVAKGIHAESSRAGQPFLAVNCAGIPTDLMESEFFGHAAGAFTGAQKARTGLLKEADGGTLLLDEIGEMPLELQAKLLRVLQEGTMRPVGSDQEVAVNVRIIAATHRDLEALVAEGTFRQDLFYRLEALTLQIPALRERGDDRELLAQHILAELTQESGTARQFSAASLDLIYQYPFPGNIRELRNAIERAVTFCQEDVIEPEHLPERMRLAAQQLAPQIDSASATNTDPQPLRTLNEVQQDYVQYVLRETGGNKRKAADILGVTRRTLYRWLDDSKEG